MTSEDKKKLKQFRKSIEEGKKTFIGYPCNCNFDYSELYNILDTPLNNVGDPFCSSYYGLDSRELELEVLEWFAKLHKICTDFIWLENYTQKELFTILKIHIIALAKI